MIENPILNSPFEEPLRHFEVVAGKFTENVVKGRRASSYLTPVARPRGARAMQLALPGGESAVRPNEFINEIRSLVRAWREAGYPGVTPTTRSLLDYWQAPERPSRLFFAQIEAVETAIYLTEFAPKNRQDIINRLDGMNREQNDALPRRAFKMATGTGKTVVMGMLIAWQTLNKVANAQDKRFADAFLIVAPGITIRDRLRVLRPEEPPEGNYYVQRDLVPPDLRDRLLDARIVITNFHAFLLRDTMDASRLNKQILGGGIQETSAAMVRRVLRDLGNKKSVIVLNDEAHHCYMALERDAETGDEAKAARVWLDGLRSVRDAVGVRAVYDLSATPFYLSSSGRTEGTLFEWVVSDFDLTDAIESGLVKIPHVPVSDDTESAIPKYRELWGNVKDELKIIKGARREDDKTPPVLPPTLEGALKSLYGDYQRAFEDAKDVGAIPPVFVIVCDDTQTSKIIADWVAGYDGFDGPASGNLPIFANVERGEWLERPRTLLIDSRQLESGEAMSASFKTAAKREIEEFRDAFRRRTGREDLDDSTILREVMNTVGRKGQLGEHTRCVVSVSMLSEGWDVNAVTHILGVRAFSTKLLCEQVIGRGLRRRSYEVIKTDEGDRFRAEYAEVYGVPFDFYPAEGGRGRAASGFSTMIHAVLERRDAMEIIFPIVVGYRRDGRPARLKATWPSKRFEVSRRRFRVAIETTMQAFVGEEKAIIFDVERRRNEYAFMLAKAVIERFFTTPDGGEESWYFPQILRIAQDWLDHQAQFEDDEATRLLEVAEIRNAVADEIGAAIDRTDEAKTLLRAETRRYDPLGSTARVYYESTKPPSDLYATERSHINYIVCDNNWEREVAEMLDRLDEVKGYVKNQGLGFAIPYVFERRTRSYLPDFIIKWDDGSGVVNVIVEVTGRRDPEKEAKVRATRERWIPAVNNTGSWGIWAFAEVDNVIDTAAAIDAAVSKIRKSLPAVPAAV